MLPTPSPTVTPGPSAAPTEFSTDYFIETIVDTTAGLKQPGYIYGDTNGNIYFTEQGHHHIRLFSAVGGLSTIAGNGTAGYNGPVGSSYYGLDAQSAMLNYPSGIFVNPNGYVYFCDTKNNRVRYAGLQFNYYSGVSSWLLYELVSDAGSPIGIWGDSSYSIYYSDAESHSIYKVQGSSSMLYAGSGIAGSGGDGGPFTSAQFNHPTGLWGK